MSNERPGLIELSLSPEEVEDLCRELMTTKGEPLARKIMRICEEKGITIKKGAAYTFLEKRFANYRERLSKRSELASYIAQHSAPEDSARIADAAGGELAELLFDFMMEDKESIDLATENGRKAANNLGLTISRLRAGDHRLRLLTAKLEEAQAKVKAQDEEKAAAIAKLSELRGASAFSDAQREAILDEVDVIMLGRRPSPKPAPASIAA